MAISLQRFANGDTNYIAKHNSNADVVEAGALRVGTATGRDKDALRVDRRPVGEAHPYAVPGALDTGGLRADLDRDAFCLKGFHDQVGHLGLVEGEIDVLRFGNGITRDMVRARRQGGDLQLHLSGANGSVTVEDWFARRAERVEVVQFADGFAWDEEDIAQLARRSRFGDADRLGREGGADGMEIARQWAAVQRHADALALGAGDLDEAGDWQPVSLGASVDARRRRSAFEAAQATEGFRSLEAQ